MIPLKLFDFVVQIFKNSNIHISRIGGARGIWLAPKLIINQALSLLSQNY
jgi:hypothetical protein